jgi:hypothetical protein
MHTILNNNNNKGLNMNFNKYSKTIDKDFAIGRELYVFSMDLTDKNTGIRNYTGIVKVKVAKKVESEFFEFHIMEGEKLKISNNIAHHLLYKLSYLNITFYTTRLEAEQAHDAKLIDMCKAYYPSKVSKPNQARILKKLIRKQKIEISTEEILAMKWYNTLNDTQKNHISWFTTNYPDGDIK